MNKQIIETKYTKSYNLLKQFIIDSMKSSGVPESTIALLPIETIIETTVKMNQRFLYDFFDKYDILLCIDNEGVDKWFVNGLGHGFKSRKSAEEYAFNVGFELLEQKLS